METITQPDTKLSFRCPEEVQRAVKIAAINRRTSIQQLCVEAICKYLKLPVPKDEAV